MIGPGSPVFIVAGHFATIAGTALLVAIWIAAGGVLLRRFVPRHIEWPSPLPLVTKALFGQCLCALLVLALGSVGLLRPPFVLILLALAAALLWRDLIGLPKALRRMAVPDSALARLTVAAWSVLALVMVVLALAPPWEWDTLMYHQDLPLEFLRTGAIRLPPDSFHVALIGVAQLASLPLLAAGLMAGPAVASVACYLLLAAALLGLARVAGEEEDGWWGALLILGASGFLLVATTARIDVTVAGALVVSQALLVWAVLRREASTLAVAAACFGVAGGMKLQALAYAAACGPVVLFFWRDRRALSIGLGVFAATLAPWLLKNAMLVGAPLYPLGAAPALEPWLAAVVGSAAIPPAFDTRAFAQLGESRAGFDLWAAFFHPGDLTIEGEGGHYGLPLVLLLLPVALVSIRRKPALLPIAVPPLLYLALIIGVLPQTNLRYLFPAIPPLIVATVIGVRALSPRLPQAGRGVIMALVAAAAVVTLFPLVRDRFGPKAVLLRWAHGSASKEDVRAGLDPSGRDIVALEESVAQLGGDALILLLWEARTAGLKPRALADTRLSNWAMLSQTSAPESCLAGTGITHVVINRRSLDYYIRRGASAEVFRVPALQTFVQRCAVESTQVRSYVVLRLRAAPLVTP